MCEIPHLCHTHTAQNSKGHCPVSAFSPGLVTLTHPLRFEEFFGGSAQKVFHGSETSWSHKDQPGSGTSETHGCQRNSEGRWTAVQNLPSPAFSTLLLSGCSLHLRPPGEVLSLPTQQIHCSVPPCGFFRPWLFSS